MRYCSLLLLIIIGCAYSDKNTPNVPSEHSASILERYETNEVVCFQNHFTNNTLWCHWKGE
jgi:hypothetical protein